VDVDTSSYMARGGQATSWGDGEKKETGADATAHPSQREKGPDRSPEPQPRRLYRWSVWDLQGTSLSGTDLFEGGGDSLKGKKGKRNGERGGGARRQKKLMIGGRGPG